MDRHTAHRNRLGLALVGIILVIGGALAFTRGLDLLPGLPAHQPLLNDAERRFAHTHTWFWYTVAVAAVLLALIAVRWLLTQAHIGAIRHHGRRCGPGSVRSFGAPLPRRALGRIHRGSRCFPQRSPRPWRVVSV